MWQERISLFLYPELFGFICRNLSNKCTEKLAGIIDKKIRILYDMSHIHIVLFNTSLESYFINLY